MTHENSKFENLNFDTRPSTGGYDVIKVEVDPSFILKGYAEAYAHELHRRNPLKWEASPNLDEDSLYFYFSYCLYLRLKYVNDQCKEFRLARALLIPDWIAFVLDKIGDVYITSMGLHIHPLAFNMDDEGNVLFGEYESARDTNHVQDSLFQKASRISTELRSFMPDGVGMSDNAFPRTKNGDVDTMSSVVIERYVFSIKEVTPIKTYVSAFVGMKFFEELDVNALFRVRYDDISYIRSRILNEESLF